MPSAIELARGDEKLVAAVHRARRLIGRKALMAAAASAVPLPGVDWMADAALLSRLVPQISAEFGLCPLPGRSFRPPSATPRCARSASSTSRTACASAPRSP